jgi:hypothetical protein
MGPHSQKLSIARSKTLFCRHLVEQDTKTKKLFTRTTDKPRGVSNNSDYSTLLKPGMLLLSMISC